MAIYKAVRPILFAQDAEATHDNMRTLGKYIGRSSLRRALKAAYAFDDESLHTHVFGIDFKNPVGLAAGFDKNAELVPTLSALGFGFIEVGTVTPRPQDGNPKPRLFRLPQDKAVLNRMGFNGKGAEWVRENLAKEAKGRAVLGINIGKNKTTPNEDAESDYRACFEMLSPLADYIVVNVSSPNTPGLRELQEKGALTNLLQTLQGLNRSAEKQKPILLKIAPDLTDGQLTDIVEIAQETDIAGIIATNTTVSREGLRTTASTVGALGAGGLSGKPLRERSNEVITFLYEKSNGAIPIIGVGGIFSAEDAYEKIRLGASLVQVYTGLIYEGPALVKKIKKGLVHLMKRDGYTSIKQAVGAAHKI